MRPYTKLYRDVKIKLETSKRVSDEYVYKFFKCAECDVDERLKSGWRGKRMVYRVVNMEVGTRVGSSVRWYKGLIVGEIEPEVRGPVMIT